MESLSIQTKHLTSLILYLSISSLFLSPPAQSITPSGTIQRTTKQQLLASIPPNTEQNSQPFITSPSTKYTAYFLRSETAPGAGGFGNDFCYIQIQDTSSEQSVWESQCTPVSNANTCSLVLSDAGIEVFDGSRSAWDTSADGNHPERLELVDEGDMRITDKDGELVWKASDEPLANQECGSPGSPGLAPTKPPFASPIGGGGNLPFGQQQPVGYQQNQPLSGVSQGFGFNGQPLVDNTPFDSGCSRGVECWFGGWLGVLVALMACGFL